MWYRGHFNHILLPHGDNFLTSCLYLCGEMEDCLSAVLAEEEARAFGDVCAGRFAYGTAGFREKLVTGSLAIMLL